MVIIEGLQGTSTYAYIMYHLKNPLVILKVIMLITEIGMFFYGVTASIFAYKVKKVAAGRKWEQAKLQESLLTRIRVILFEIESKEENLKRYGYRDYKRGVLWKIYLEINGYLKKKVIIKNPYLKRFMWWFLFWLGCRIVYNLLIWIWFPFKAWHFKKFPIEYLRIFWKFWHLVKEVIKRIRLYYVLYFRSLGGSEEFLYLRSLFWNFFWKIYVLIFCHIRSEFVEYALQIIGWIRYIIRLLTGKM